MKSKLQLLYGFHAVLTRLRVDALTIHNIYFDDKRKDQRMLQLQNLARAHQRHCEPLTALALNELCGHSRHQGVIAKASWYQPAHDLYQILEQSEQAPLLLALDAVTDPHNLGAILRSAEACCVNAVIAPKDRAVGITPAVAKVSSGASDIVPYVMVTNLARELRELKDQCLQVIGLSERGRQPIYAIDLTRPTLLVLGAEGKGMRGLTEQCCDELCHLPMLGSIPSLNVSVAAAVCLYEALRQRHYVNKHPE